MNLMRRLAALLGGQQRVEQSADNIPMSGIAPDLALVDVELVAIADARRARREEHRRRAVGSASAARAPRAPRLGNDTATVRGALNALRSENVRSFTLSELRRRIDEAHGQGVSATFSVSATVSNNRKSLKIERVPDAQGHWRFAENSAD